MHYKRVEKKKRKVDSVMNLAIVLYLSLTIASTLKELGHCLTF